jgi:hypothetical protein
MAVVTSILKMLTLPLLNDTLLAAESQAFTLKKKAIFFYLIN